MSGGRLSGKRGGGLGMGKLPLALRKFNEACAKERKEHPSFSRAQVRRIVKDHLK